MMRLENWGFTSTSALDPYLAPELARTKAVGKVYGNPKFEDGENVVTSVVDKFDLEAMVIHTRSGSVYQLGKMAPEFAKFLESNFYALSQYAAAIDINRGAVV